MEKISAVIITLNEERNIARCLESISWVDEIIIVDAFSKDNTVIIGSQYTDKIFQRKWPGYSEQRNFGLSQAKSDWVLFIDADERVSPLLADEIKRLLQNKPEPDGYYLLCQAFYAGQKIKYGEWNPDWKLRLVRRGKARWGGPRVHERLLLDGQAAYLENPFFHFTYRDIGQHLRKLNLYSTLFAQGAAENNEAVNLRKLVFEPLVRFKNGYFVKAGYKDGLAGLTIAVLQSLEVFLRYVKLLFLNLSGIIKKRIKR